jgi:hypothetical protein
VGREAGAGVARAGSVDGRACERGRERADGNGPRLHARGSAKAADGVRVNAPAPQDTSSVTRHEQRRGAGARTRSQVTRRARTTRRRRQLARPNTLRARRSRSCARGARRAPSTPSSSPCPCARALPVRVRGLYTPSSAAHSVRTPKSAPATAHTSVGTCAASAGARMMPDGGARVGDTRYVRPGTGPRATSADLGAGATSNARARPERRRARARWQVEARSRRRRRARSGSERDERTTAHACRGRRARGRARAWMADAGAESSSRRG